MLVSIIVLYICLAIATVISHKCKFKQENSLTITILLLVLFIYIAGLFNLMRYAVYMIYIMLILSTIYILYCLIKKKIKIKDIITPGVLIYGVVIFIMNIIVSNTYYYEWDEFSHWGANLKAMVQYDLFWSNNIYDGVHVVYTPIAGLIEYFFCKINGGFSETVSYIAINFFIITLLLSICNNEKYSIKSFFKLLLFWICIYCIIKLCNFSLSSIYIDLLLGILFAVGMFLAYRSEKKEDKISLTLIIIIMPLLKDTGLLLIGIILMQLFFNKVLLKIIKEKKISKDNFKKLGILILILIISLSLYGTWKIYCSNNNRYLDDRHDKNAISEINIKEYIKAVLLLTTENSKYSDIANTFYNNLNSGTVVGDLVVENNNINITTIKLVIILNFIGFILYFTEKNEDEKLKILVNIITFNVGFLMYLLLLMATFMFAFTETEGRALASYSRYITTYFIAWIINILGIIVLGKERRKVITMLIFLFLCIYPVNILGLMDVNSRKGISGISDEIKTEAEIITNNVKLNEKVYLIYQNNGGGYDYHKLRYSISPIVTNLMYEWSLGPKYNDSDIWSYDITKYEFEQKLINEHFDYVFIANIDKQFFDIYGSLIIGDYTEQNYETLNNKLFKVNIMDNNVSLSLIKEDI